MKRNLINYCFLIGLLLVFLPLKEIRAGYKYANIYENIFLIKRIITSSDTLNLSNKKDTSIIISSNYKFIEFDFYSNEDRTSKKFRYRLRGYDEKWSDWSFKNVAIYTNINAGEYVFELQSFNESQTVHLYIEAKNTWIWATALLIIILISLLILVHKWGVIDNIKKVVMIWNNKSIVPFVDKVLNSDSDKLGLDKVKISRRASIKYDKVTVLFADIQGFTRIVEHMNPETLVDQLDKFFIHFDGVAEKYKIEKIKTIGDAYMCAGGLPEKNRTNPIEVVLAAMEMQNYMQTSGQMILSDRQDFWELRIGIHTGPVISGVIGRKKLSFDIWGDTVNIASRMESSGVAGKVNISGVTYQLIKDFFVCEYRGKMPIKYKGETDMYFVKSINPDLSENREGIVPNSKFFTRLQWIRYNDLEEVVLEQLKNEIPTNHKFHHVGHTIEICLQAELIGRSEGLGEQELLLVKTAALFYNTGYLVNHKQHVDHSIQIATELLPHYNYKNEEIEIINELIYTTYYRKKPLSLLDKVILDANMYYVGRPDFIPLSEKLRDEVSSLKGKISNKEWYNRQYELVSKHDYHTPTANKMRLVSKEIQLKKLRDLGNN